jgi:translocation protein SEC62
MTSNEPGGKMSRKNKKQQQQQDESEVPELTKEETQIARYLRLNCPNKQGNLVGMKVDFFIGNKLVDCLMESKWGPGTLNPQTSKRNDTQPLLVSRVACIAFMQRLMNKQLFFRAIKIYKEQATTQDSKSKSDSNSESTPNNLRKRKEKKEQTTTMTETPVASSSSNTDEQQKQQKKKFKLETHEEQKFLDSNEPYVWVYDPTSMKTYIIGGLLILGAIGICLFPLWPSSVREGVYYLSLAGASFLGAILGLVVIKYILFAFIWIATLGNTQFWLFPNLTEDVGFFESFVPVYKIKCGSASSKTDSNISSNKTSDSGVKLSNQDETSTNETEAATNQLETINDNLDLNPICKEISKSTIEVCKGTTPKPSPSVSNRLKKKDSIINDEDGFELLDDDDLIKEDK